jgi:organic hydroperoxide reductase OsmC/OhrA
MLEYTYQLETIWIGAAKTTSFTYENYSREYQINIADKPSLIASADPHFRGDSNLYNPEDLLIASLSGCHMLSYLALCARSRIKVINYRDNAIGKMAKQDGKIRFIEVILHPQVVIEAVEYLDEATQLHYRAHQECFIANSVNFPVLNQPIVSIIN